MVEGSNLASGKSWSSSSTMSPRNWLLSSSSLCPFWCQILRLTPLMSSMASSGNHCWYFLILVQKGRESTPAQAFQGKSEDSFWLGLLRSRAHSATNVYVLKNGRHLWAQLTLHAPSLEMGVKSGSLQLIDPQRKVVGCWVENENGGEWMMNMWPTYYPVSWIWNKS